MLRKSASLFLMLVLWLTIAPVPTLAGVPTGATTSVAGAEVGDAERDTARDAARDATYARESAGVPQVGSRGMLRIDGSPEMLRINEQLKQRYQSQFPDTTVTVEARGTEAALQALLKGEVDLAAISRPLTLEERAQGLIEIPVAQEKIAILVGRDNSFRGALTIEQLTGIFQGTITDWSEVGGTAGPIRVIDRPDTSETRLALVQYGILPRMRLRWTGNRVKLESDDTAAVIRQLGDDGIGYAIADQIPDMGAVRLVKIAVLQDTLPGDAHYPYVQPQSYAFKAASDSSAESFLSFATTAAGQTAIAQAKTAEMQAIVAALAAPIASSSSVSPLPLAPEPALSPGKGVAAAPAPTVLLSEPDEPQKPQTEDNLPEPATSPVPADREPEPDSAPTLAEQVQAAEARLAAERAVAAETAPTTSPEPAASDEPSSLAEQVQSAQAKRDAALAAEAELPPELPPEPSEAGQPALQREPTDAPVVITPVPPGKIGFLPAHQPVEATKAEEFPAAEPEVVAAPVARPEITPAARPSSGRPFFRQSGKRNRVPLAWGLGLPFILLAFLVGWLLKRNQRETLPPIQSAASRVPVTTPPAPTAPAQPAMPEGRAKRKATERVEPRIIAQTPARPLAETATPEVIETSEVPAAVPEVTPDVVEVAEIVEIVEVTEVAEVTGGTEVIEAILEEPEAEILKGIASSNQVELEVIDSRRVESIVTETPDLLSNSDDVEDTENVNVPEPAEGKKGVKDIDITQKSTKEAIENAVIVEEVVDIAAIAEAMDVANRSDGSDEPNTVERTGAEIFAGPIVDASALVAKSPTRPIQPPAVPPTQPGVAADTPPVPPAPAGVESLPQMFVDYLQRLHGKTLETATPQEHYSALAQLVCNQLLQQDLPETALAQPGTRLVVELSAEYMPGPHLANHLLNLGILPSVQQSLEELGLDLDELLQQEEEPGLGKGGLGRLMSCYLDSLSTANVPAIGYGIRYQYGIFDQDIRDGWQVEIPDSWLQYGNPWERERPEAAVTVGFGGHSEAYLDEQKGYCVRWLAAEQVTGIPYDTPISGYRTGTVNLMRLWSAENSQQLCQVLYPVDGEGRGEQRLKQQFFLVSCALQDVLRLHLQAGGRPDTLPERMALQINDTDPTLAIAELMRLLLDQHQLPWDQAWMVTQRSFAYTNHSLLPESLDDQWTVDLFGRLLPRHLEIIFEINNRFLDQVRSQYPNDAERVARMSLIDERGNRYVRMTYLACVGSHSINGISQLHTQLLQATLLRDFYDLYPQKFSNKTNGVSPRRFLRLINPGLADLISSQIGEGWMTDLSRLRQLESFVEDAQFRQAWQQVKQANKQALAAYIRQHNGIEVNPRSLFDVHTMRMHEYKRQHLNLLHILTLYRRLKTNPNLAITPRTFIFAGKAAPDYFTAKLMIRLIHAVAEVVNGDPDVKGRLKVVFVRDYNIKVAQIIYPAADLAEYLSLAGTEACSTGNFIYAMNGSLVIGTPDGSNLELQEAVGAENFFQFGLTVPEVVALDAAGYQPHERYQAHPDLKAVLDLIGSGMLSDGDTELFRPLVNLLLYPDQYKLLADYSSYIDCQDQIGLVYQDSERWTRMSILNAARMGRFSSDRAIHEYCQDIWQIECFAQPLPEFAPT